MQAVDTDRAFINMVLTKGEADQRGSRQARCVCHGAFKELTLARGRRAGMFTPSNSILTKKKLAMVIEKNATETQANSKQNAAMPITFPVAKSLIQNILVTLLLGVATSCYIHSQTNINC